LEHQKKTNEKLILIMAVSATTHPLSPPKYPQTKKGDVVDTFGTQVNDPYRWMEDDRSDETAWVKAKRTK
jgi:prolyl oligopeptidase